MTDQQVSDSIYELGKGPALERVKRRIEEAIEEYEQKDFQPDMRTSFLDVFITMAELVRWIERDQG